MTGTTDDINIRSVSGPRTATTKSNVDIIIVRITPVFPCSDMSKCLSWKRFDKSYLKISNLKSEYNTMQSRRKIIYLLINFFVLLFL